MRPKGYKFIVSMILLLMMAAVFAGCSVGAQDSEEGTSKGGILSSTEDINLRDIDGGGAQYLFTYGEEDFSAQYLYGIWTVFDSYKITDKGDQTIICQALIDEHPVLGKDMESYRTAEDMAYEWQQHNMAYAYMPEDNAWRDSAANVDFDPEDQGRSFKEIYEDRTGEKLDVKEKIKERIESGEIIEDIKHFLGQ